jgi:aldehyde:ferredoxin oxidoreductase
MVLEGQPGPEETPKLLHLDKDGARLLPAEDLWGLGNYDTADAIKERYGDRVGLISIGQAGERLLVAASVAFTDKEFHPTRHAGRGGLGAVMGSKRVKAIVLDPTGCGLVPIANEKAFKQAVKRFSKILAGHPVTGKNMPTYGTPMLIHVINEAGGLPTCNFSRGRFEGASKLSGETLRDMIAERKGILAHGCMTGCIIRCSAIWYDENSDYLSKRPEYETLAMWGSNCGIGDPDAIARIDRACDDLGVDTIETGSAVAIAMEARLIPFGDSNGAEKLMHEMVRGTVLGRVLASGATTVGRVFGVRRVPAVKGQAMGAYDPRALKGYGATYATSPMGADHTAGITLGPNLMGPQFGLQREGQAQLSMLIQQITAAFLDTAGICLFANGPLMQVPGAKEAVVDMINARAGLDLQVADLENLGKRILRLERAFNIEAGFSPFDNRLPEFFSDEPLPPHNSVFDVSHEELYQVWQCQTG